MAGTIEIPWNDGSGQSIQVTYLETEEGKGRLNFLSPSNQTNSVRQKVLDMKVPNSSGVFIQITLTQKVGSDGSEGIGDMIIGQSFIVR